MLDRHDVVHEKRRQIHVRKKINESNGQNVMAHINKGAKGRCLFFFIFVLTLLLHTLITHNTCPLARRRRRRRWPPSCYTATMGAADGLCLELCVSPSAALASRNEEHGSVSEG